MQNTPETAQTPSGQTARGAMQFRAGVLGLGIADVVLLVTYGVVLKAPTVSTMSVLVLLPVFALMIASASVSGVPPRRRMLYNILTPITGGLVAVTLVFGMVFFPGSVVWWVPAALLSAAPFLAIALLHHVEASATAPR
jgi:hypothetical protein